MRTYQQVYDSGCPERGKLSMRVMVAEEVEDLDVVAQMLRDHTLSKVCPVTGQSFTRAHLVKETLDGRPYVSGDLQQGPGPGREVLV